MTSLNPVYAQELMPALNDNADNAMNGVLTYVSDDDPVPDDDGPLAEHDDDNSDEELPPPPPHNRPPSPDSVLMCFLPRTDSDSFVSPDSGSPAQPVTHVCQRMENITLPQDMPPPGAENALLNQSTMGDLKADPQLTFLDTGATAHVSNSLEGKVADRKRVSCEIFRNHGTAIPILCRFDEAGFLHNKDNKRISRIVLKGVNYAPESSFNLFSVSHSLKKGWKIYGNFSGFTLTKGSAKINVDIRIRSGSGYLWATRLVPEGTSEPKVELPLCASSVVSLRPFLFQVKVLWLSPFVNYSVIGKQNTNLFGLFAATTQRRTTPSKSGPNVLLGN